eukprot:1530044-Rhodomonas_salina.1
MHIQDRARQSRAEQSRAEQSRAEQSRLTEAEDAPDTRGGDALTPLRRAAVVVPQSPPGAAESAWEEHACVTRENHTPISGSG